MADSWVLSTGLKLPDPDVLIYVRREAFEKKGERPPIAYRRDRPTKSVTQAALDTYRRAADNALSLIEEAEILVSRGHHARAFALACTALEEIGKSQYAADVYTGFVPPEEFEKMIRKHQFKSAYPSRFVELGPLIQPVLKDQHVADELFSRRNDALYASPTNEVDDAAFEQDAATMIDYCLTWIERIRRQEDISERIGTKGFLK